jgi:cyclohexa-1,5-dienecarbonyl-CoA hydratase
MALVDVHVTENVARVVLDRAPLNVIDLGLARTLVQALEEVRNRPGVSLLLLTARGKAFCAGVDVRDHLPDRGEEMLHEFHRICRLLLEMECVVVAAVQGPALGGGCELVQVCDLAIASSRAIFGQPEIKLGVFPPVAAAALPRIVPPQIAHDMLFTGRVLNAEEARQAGLVSRVANEEDFPAAVEKLVGEISALSASSVRLTKRAIRAAGNRIDPDEIDAAERFYVKELMRTPDAIEGLKAFLEKRLPAWTHGG